MSDLKQKFTIGPDGFKMGRVYFHKDLDPNAKGGGYWFWDQEQDVLYLYGTSYDFGPVNPKQVNDNLDDIMVRPFENSTVNFTPDPDVSLLKVLAKNMDTDRALELIQRNDYV